MFEYEPCDGFPHTHSLDESDMFKINEAVKCAVEAELAKGYDAKTVTNTFQSKGKEGCYEALEAAGGKYLERSTVQGWKQKLKTTATLTNPRKTNTNRDWVDELSEAEAWCKLDKNLHYEVIYSQSQAGEELPGIVWASNHRLKTLAERGYLTLFDSTHKTNQKEWKLFTWMVRTEVNIYLPCAGALIQSEDGNSIGKAMSVVRDWTKEESGQDWKIRYCLTDDSAAEQRAVQIAFPKDDSIYGSVQHFYCKWHSKMTLDRQLSGEQLRQANEHLKAALFSRRTETGCDESIQAAIDSIPNGTKIRRRGKDWDPKKYIENEWKATKKHWANYARQDDYILRQVGTTGANEGWHNTLKTAMGLRKNANSHYSLAGVIQTFQDCARVVDNRVSKDKIKWKTKQLSLCAEYDWLKLFPLPAQVILADNFKLAESRQMEESQPIRAPLGPEDECDCVDFRKWNLPYQHMLELWIFIGNDIEPNWDKYASMFDEQMFDVYEGRKVDIAMVEVGQDSQGEHVLNRILARSKFDLDETANRIKDRRFALEDKMRQSGIPIQNIERMMRAFNRAYASAVRHLEGMSLEAQMNALLMEDLH
jgi:MULE transposase domain